MRYLNNCGASKMFLWLAEHLASEGHTVTVYTYSYIKDVRMPQNVKAIRDDLDKCRFFSKVKKIRQRIKDSDSDVAISFLLDANIYNMFACTGLRTKSVVCERNDPFKPRYYKLRFWKPWFRLADGAVFQLKKVGEYYSNIKGRTVVIPNPVTIKNAIRVKPFEEREKTIVTLGRLDIFQKRQDVLIRAFAQFYQEHTEYKLIIYGQGPDENRLRGLVATLGLQDCVIFFGNTSTPLKAIEKAKIFVLSSDFEGIPNSLMEAMAIGLPCIATDCRPGGSALLIENMVNGLLCPRGDTEELAKCMSWLVEHPKDADRMGGEAQKISARFSEESISKMWSEYVQSFES